MNAAGKITRITMLAALVAGTFCAPLAASFSLPGAWYAALNKPAWNPPAWIFGPVWTVLYLLMAVAAWLVWRKDGWRLPMWLYLVQLTINASWSPVFFGAKQPGAAFGVIVALWLAIALTLRAFRHVSRPAGWMMVPYLLWVSFATVLNLALWRLNP